jgi:3-(3-hydroxy-phenyl)propionate hydroxylase
MQVDVVIVGCGPVGALTANLLGARGIRTLVVERSDAPHGQPRAFSCDDEALRIYQQTGLLDELRAGMYAPHLVEYINAKGSVFSRITLSEIDFGLGAPPLHFFDQPKLEHTLRRGLERFAQVELRLGTEMVKLAQDGEGVTVQLRDVASQQLSQVRARYVLGCDGARSATRAAAGIELVGSTYAEPWLAVSGDVPADFVRLGHTRFVCDYRRPAFVSPGADGSYRLEFMLKEGETDRQMLQPAVIGELAAPYVDPEHFEITRAVVYTFHHLVADRWRDGRVFLLGDAAHQMPPFLGQGLCSGLRDAVNLSWKLALVLDGAAEPELLDSYETERRPHTEEMAKTSVQLGYIFLARSRAKAAVRDFALRAVQLVPRVRRFFERFEFKPLPAHHSGLMLTGKRRGGEGTMFPQPRVTGPESPAPVLLDSLLGEGFAVIGTGVRPEHAADQSWQGLPVRFIRVRPDGAQGLGEAGVTEVIDAGGAVESWLRKQKADVAVLRPDRFVYAAGSAAQLPSFAAALVKDLRQKASGRANTAVSG